MNLTSKQTTGIRSVGLPAFVALATSGLGFLLNYGFQIEAVRILSKEGFFLLTLWLSYFAMFSVAGNVVQNLLILHANQGVLARLRIPTVVVVVVLGILHGIVSDLPFGVTLVESAALTVLFSAWLGVAFGSGAWIAAYVPSMVAFTARLIALEIIGKKGPLYAIASTPISILVALAFVFVVFRHVPHAETKEAPTPPRPLARRAFLGAMIVGFAQAGSVAADLILAKVRTSTAELELFARILLVTRVPLLVALALLNMTLGRHAVAHRNHTEDKTAAMFERILVIGMLASTPLVVLLLPYVPGLFRGFDGLGSFGNLRILAALSMLDHCALVAVLVRLHRSHAREEAPAEGLRLLVPVTLLIASAWIPGLSLPQRLTIHLALYTCALVLVSIRRRVRRPS